MRNMGTGTRDTMDAVAIRLAQQVGDRAVAWLGSMRTGFTLARDVPDERIGGDGLKSLAELALAAGLVRREAVAGPRCAQTAQGLLDFAWREFDEGDLLYRLQAHTPAATHPIEIYSLFAAAGYRHERLDRLAGHLLGLRASRVIEHVPNRRLAVVAAATRIGVPVHDDVDALIAQTWLGGTPEPWMLDANNAYGVTHTVFHLTDWGSRPEGLPDRLQDYLHLWLPVWTEVFCETRFWDLLLEFLIVGTCLQRPLFFPSVWERVAEAQHADGMVPNGLTVPPADSRAAWLNHHHPTVVAAVAGTLAVSRALTVPAASAGGAG
ncbi:hypothetical protein Misp01_65800 [Microtetraspora sp. NBRC 13810]|uniref:DUF6895 family protein n=1 Tax=Microtetraspora sp. NBRC 13810 TaxID=3030990 RepID=UPI0024A5A77D|nr:hypothetical protein [Microtetraspora sp. NBRC 13810]GLW11452.1 hypothetical protein Misp01_65800 [Microtetraspora sp. NBRC 13810]